MNARSMSVHVIFVALFVLAITSISARGSEVYLCTAPNGTKMATDRPCPALVKLPRDDPKPGTRQPPSVEEQIFVDRENKKLRAAESMVERTLPATPEWPSSQSVNFPYDQCVSRVRVIIQSVTPLNARYIVRSQSVTMAKVCTVEGTVIITCSRPDEKMVTTQSNDRSGCVN